MSFVINFVDLSVCDISQSQNGTMSKSHHYYQLKSKFQIQKAGNYRISSRSEFQCISFKKMSKKSNNKMNNTRKY